MKGGRYRLNFERNWLLDTAIAIEKGNKTLTQAAERAHVIILSPNGDTQEVVQSVSPNTLKRAFQRMGLLVPIRKGPKETVIVEQFKGVILSVQRETGMGATKVFEQIVARSEENPLFERISHNMVYKTLQDNSLLKYRKPAKPSQKRCRYEADYPDLIWHTDLHNFAGQYLIAFIDDYSRYVVHVELLPTKDSSVIKTVFEIAIQHNNRPFCIWTDNGTEFKGHFKQFCDSNNIKIVLTKVANPEQNGKCERFWRTADNCKDPGELRQWVNAYNNMPHMGLPQITVNGRKTHMSPMQRYSNGTHWNQSIKPTWTVDGISKEFQPPNKPNGLIFCYYNYN